MRNSAKLYKSWMMNLIEKIALIINQCYQRYSYFQTILTFKMNKLQMLSIISRMNSLVHVYQKNRYGETSFKTSSWRLFHREIQHKIWKARTHSKQITKNKEDTQCVHQKTKKYRVNKVGLIRSMILTEILNLDCLNCKISHH